MMILQMSWIFPALAAVISKYYHSEIIFYTYQLHTSRSHFRNFGRTAGQDVVVTLTPNIIEIWSVLKIYPSFMLNSSVQLYYALTSPCYILNYIPEVKILLISGAAQLLLFFVA